jgi:hypothetical protein
VDRVLATVVYRDARIAQRTIKLYGTEAGESVPVRQRHVLYRPTVAARLAAICRSLPVVATVQDRHVFR